METPQLIQGNIHTDERGILKFMNELDMSVIKRFYTIQNANTDIIRAWQGHKIESKWFFVLKGSFKIGLVKIDDWDNPSLALKPEFYTLQASKHEVLYIPKGYANGFFALEPDAVLMIYSDYLLEDSKDDNFRFDTDLWVNWKEIKNK